MAKTKILSIYEENKRLRTTAHDLFQKNLNLKTELRKDEELFEIVVESCLYVGIIIGVTVLFIF